MKLPDFNIDPRKSIVELSGTELLRYDFPTSLMKRVYDLAHKPIEQIDDEGLRLMLVQKQFPEFIVPAAICWLSSDPFSGGDLEEGALMRSLFQNVTPEFWTNRPSLLVQASTVLDIAICEAEKRLKETEDPEVLSLLKEAQDNFFAAKKHRENISA